MKRRKHLKACHFEGRAKHIPHHSPYTLIPIEIVKLESNSYHIITPFELKGIKGEAIIDTGASVTVIDNNLLEGNETEKTGIQIQSGSVTGQIEEIKVIQIKEVKIGNHRFGNMQLAAINLDYVKEMYNRHLDRKIIALLGSDFCVKHCVVIDYKKKILICRR